MNNGTTNWSCDTCGEVLNSVKARGHKCRIMPKMLICSNDKRKDFEKLIREDIVMRGGIRGRMIGKVQKGNYEKLLHPKGTKAPIPTPKLDNKLR